MNIEKNSFGKYFDLIIMKMQILCKAYLKLKKHFFQISALLIKNNKNPFEKKTKKNIFIFT